MRGKNVVISLTGLAIIVAAIIVVAWLLRPADPYPQLILDAVNIRAVGNNSLMKARIIDDMDKNIGRVSENDILDRWDEITGCLNTGCSDDALFDFILSIVIARQEKVPNAKFIADVIVAGRFWGSTEVLKFSKAVTAANEAVAATNAKNIDKKWDEVVACDGKCAEKNNLIFDEIKLVLDKGLQE